LLTADAIPEVHQGLAVHPMIIVVFLRQVGYPLPSVPGSRQNRIMRNPDKWSPMEPDGPGGLWGRGRGDGDRGDGGRGQIQSRRGALLGLLVVLLLVAGGLVLTRVLRGMAQTQDCALSGRSNCT